MANEFNQMRPQDGEAKRMLLERMARKEMGDAAYEKDLSYADNRAFKIFGVIFIVIFAMIVFAVAGMGF
ncbi:MAG: hypothetical protein ACK4MV_05405 [Beijerinckiaceae bacterium]